MYKLYMPDVQKLHARCTSITCPMYNHRIGDVHLLKYRCTDQSVGAFSKKWGRFYAKVPHLKSKVGEHFPECSHYRIN